MTKKSKCVENSKQSPPVELTIVPSYMIWVVIGIIAIIFYLAITGPLDFAYKLIAGLIGLPLFIYTFMAIYSGKVIFASFYNAGGFLRDKNPVSYWFGIIIYGAVGIFLISKLFD